VLANPHVALLKTICYGEQLLVLTPLSWFAAQAAAIQSPGLALELGEDLHERTTWHSERVAQQSLWQRLGSDCAASLAILLGGERSLPA
jgi:hypothetical protein